MRSQRGAIACRSLSKVFDHRTVVDDVTFEVPAGTITGFVGANGAGKTTTMRMLLGLVAPTTGSALVNGRPYHELRNPRREVGAVVDGPGAHPGHSGRTHLRILAGAAGLPRRRVDEVLDLVELTAHAHRRVDEFSMGMLQRLALAGALLGDPGVLVLDEPVNGLDPPGILWMRDLLRRLAAEGRALLVSSHLLAELAEVADRVVIIDGGRLVADTTLDDLLAAQAPVVEVRCAHPDLLHRELRARGLTVGFSATGDRAGDRAGDRIGDRIGDPADGTRPADDMLLVEGSTAREVGELAAAIGAGPIHWLTQRSSSFEDVYFRLAESGRPAPSGTHHGPQQSASARKSAHAAVGSRS